MLSQACQVVAVTVQGTHHHLVCALLQSFPEDGTIEEEMTQEDHSC